MSSTYSTSLRAELIGPGDQAGAWGTTTNNNFNYIFDVAIAGYQSVNIATSPYTLTSVSGPTSTASQNESIYAALRIYGTPANLSIVYAPAVPKTYIIWNDSAYSIKIYNTGNAIGPTIAAGARVLVFSTGTAFYEVLPQSISGVLPVANGGTGVTTSTGTGNTVLSASPSLTGTIGLGATWTVVESGGVLYFKSSGTNVASLTAAGNLTVTGSVTSFGTP